MEHVFAHVNEHTFPLQLGTVTLERTLELQRLGEPRELRHPHAERVRQPEDVLQARVSLAALDPAHVCAVEVRGVGEGLLGEAALRPKLPERATVRDVPA
jgi:hypothetical protein